MTVTNESVRQRAEQDAKSHGYYLNSDPKFLQDLLEGLKTNEDRYGYPSCPCRAAAGAYEQDRDIICPCDYRDTDLDEFGACYCALYVSEAVMNKEREVTSIPERRPAPEQRHKNTRSPSETTFSGLSYPIWRCKVCGYLCAREGPPEVCPICKASKERFERFI